VTGRAMISEATPRRVRAALAGLAAAVGSLFLSIPATAIMAGLLRPAQMDSMQTARGALEFQRAYVDVSLLPALVCAIVMFIAAFVWMLRRRASER
jgi:hypothetical protein